MFSPLSRTAASQSATSTQFHSPLARFRHALCSVARPRGRLSPALGIACLSLFLTLQFHGNPAAAQSGTTVVSVTATVPVAGPQPGVFTITRAGDASQPLTVPLNLSGTARTNIDYTADSSASGALPALFATGQVGQAFSFNGQGQYVQGPEDPKLDPTEEATIDAWVFFNQLPSAAGSPAMMIADKSDFGRDFLLDAEPDNRFHFSIGTGLKVASTTVIQTGRWYHVAATYKALTEIKIYVNGVLENTRAIDQRRAPADVPFAIGRTFGLAFLVGPCYFNGLIDEVQVFNRVLSDAEIRSIFAADTAGLCKPAGQTPNCVQPPADLVGWFAGDGDARNIAENIFSPGKVAQAFTFNTTGTHFNGTGEYVQYPSNAIQDPTTAGSQEAWVYFNQTPSAVGHIMEIIGKGSIFRDFDLQAETDNRFRFYVGDDRVASTTVIQAGVWYHVAATWDATGLRMYVNGVLENTNPVQNLTRGQSNQPLMIGNQPFFGPRLFYGLIDEAQMYNRALSTAEIQAIYNADSAGLCKPVAVTGCVQPPAGLVGWWPGDGDTRDLVTKARGTLVGYDNRLFGQQLTFAAGQTSIAVNIRPLFSPNSAGKSVVLTLLPDPQNSYALDGLRSSATVALRGQTPSTEVSLTGISPNRGGNTASVTPIIYGQGFKPGVTVKLVRAGQADIVATQTTPAPDEFSVAATFDLNGKAPGVYDVVVANAGGTAKTLTGAFTVEPTARGSLFVKVVSRKIIRIGNEYNFYIEYGNDGNVDETNVLLYATVPNFVSITPDTNLPFRTESDGADTYITFTLPRVRAGSNLQPEVIPIRIKVADPLNVHRLFRMRAAIFPPASSSGSSGSGANNSNTVPRPLADCGIWHCTPAPPGSDDGGGDTDPRMPNDPNEKSGSGIGVQGFISGKTALPYAIYFENLDTASLPAQDVVVTDQLDLSKVDAATFSFGVISFGNRRFTPPAGQNSFVGYVDLRPGQNLLLKIAADFDATTGRITWTFNSLDPATGRPPDDPLAGFLPPNRTSPEGQGSVLFTVMPKASLTTNTAITNQARIVFDVNAPIDTNLHLNTIDKAPPVSRVGALPTRTSAQSFTVNWSGTDVGAGVAVYTIYVSQNGGPFTPFLTNTPLTSAIFNGSFGSTYSFYSVATDLTGNAEPAKTVAEATTTLVASSAVQFSATTYQVGEGEGRVTLTVTRAGDPSGTASVDYQTADTDTFTVGCADTTNNHGGAYARCDFATVVGTLSFAAGETSQTISIPVIDDALVEGDETFQVRLTNAAGATLGTLATATVTIHDNNDTAGAPNPVFSSPFFVRQHYLDFLSREPEPSGLQAWLGVLNNCPDINNLDPNSPSAQCDRILVSQSFFGSPEFQLKGFYVFRFYKLAFNRLPEYLEIIPDMSFVAGQTAEEVFARKAQLAVSFTQRQEFTNTYGAQTNAQYVAALLGRYQLTQVTTPDPAQPDGVVQPDGTVLVTKVTLTQAELVSRLAGGTLTRAQVLRAVADSDQVGAAEFNNAFVAMQYYGYLRRKPEPGGYEAWLRVLQGGDIRTMVNGFMNSQEYKLRFGQP